MKKVYYLSTCDTCKRILDEINLPESFVRQDIKNEKISEEQLDQMQQLSGSYESLFSKRAKLYKEKNLKNEELDEGRFKNLILEHHTFLKRPVIINNDKIFIGNSKKTVAEAKESVHG
jgi:arsenate reductase